MQKVNLTSSKNIISVPVPQLPALQIKWDMTTLHAKKYTIEGNTITKIDDGDWWYQLVGSDPLPKGLTTLKATIKKYGSKYEQIGFGLLTESRRNEEYSGD